MNNYSNYIYNKDNFDKLEKVIKKRRINELINKLLDRKVYQNFIQDCQINLRNYFTNLEIEEVKNYVHDILEILIVIDNFYNIKDFELNLNILSNKIA